MNVTRRTLTGLFMAVAVMLASLQMAAARGTPAPVGSMVICAGQGVVTVMVDAEGNPTGAVHICPDCALSLFSSDGGGFVLTSAAPVWLSLTPDFAQARPGGALAPAAQARGPPGLV